MAKSRKRVRKCSKCGIRNGYGTSGLCNFCRGPSKKTLDGIASGKRIPSTDAMKRRYPGSFESRH
jgi:hypothetical protein